MALRAFIAAIVALVVLSVGVVLIMNAKGAGVEDVRGLLFSFNDQALRLCAIAAWAAVVAGGLGVLASFAAFFDDEDDDGFRRRGFPKGIPAVLMIVSLVLFWTAFDCGARERVDEQVAAVAESEPEVELADADEVDTELLGAPEETAPPPVLTNATRLTWQYMYPLIRGERHIQSDVMNHALTDFFTAGDGPSDARDILCGNAWVALTGAASEEGPRARNQRRSRLRAEIVVKRANDWLDAHSGDDCPRPVVFGLDLGQHVSTGATDAQGGAATGYQRQMLGVSRALADGEEGLTETEAAGELRAFLADPANRATWLSGRTYADPAKIIEPLGY